MTTKYPVLL